ncbi:hypothetical protein D9M71_468050 [compost metagenome]
MLMPTWPTSTCRVAVLRRVIDLATKLVSSPVAVKSMLVSGGTTSRGSSGTHWPLAVGASMVMVTGAPVTGSRICWPLESASGT